MTEDFDPNQLSSNFLFNRVLRRDPPPTLVVSKGCTDGLSSYTTKGVPCSTALTLRSTPRGTFLRFVRNVFRDRVVLCELSVHSGMRFLALALDREEISFSFLDMIASLPRARLKLSRS